MNPALGIAYGWMGVSPAAWTVLWTGWFIAQQCRRARCR